MITYQDFLNLIKETNIEKAILDVVQDWKSTNLYKMAITADKYDRQENEGIMNVTKKIFNLQGKCATNFASSNNKIPSNFFRRFNVQRKTYSLGNGISFEKEGIKEKFGFNFDKTISDAAYKALIHGVSFPVWDGENLIYFKATEFAPLWDEETNALMAGIRFWQIDRSKPKFFVLYEKEGRTKFKIDEKGNFSVIQEKTPYRYIVSSTRIDGEEIIDTLSYNGLPIFAFWGSSLRQSTLVGLKAQIDCYDLIRSGFANDLEEVAQIYWLVENYNAMTDEDLQKFMDKIRILHIAEADTSEGGKITPYTQEVPYQARQELLKGLREDMYEGFGALDVHKIAAGNTNDHIEAAYQPLDEEADDFEFEIISVIQQIGFLIGLNKNECIPIFKRNKISNNTEFMQMLASADWIDEETKIKKTPFISVDEQEKVLERLMQQEKERMISFNNGSGLND